MTEIDKSKCINCNLCASICPEVFETDKNGETVVKDKNAKPNTLKEAASSCPVGAITE